MRIFFSLITLIIIATGRPACAQSDASWQGFGVEANIMAGKMIRHNSRFTGPISDQCYSAELNFIKQTYGQKDWQQRRNYPQLGLGIYYNNYNLPEIYGRAIGIFPNIQLRLISTPKVEWTFRAGMGVCYINRHYQRLPVANLENVAIGGNWNNISPFATDLRWRVNSHWDVQAGVHFSHVSNAGFQQPNLGINIFGARLGVRYFPVTAQPVKLRRELKPLRSRLLLQARASVAFIESNPADGPLNPVYMGAVFVSKRYLGKNKVYAGVDYYFNTAKYSLVKTIEHFNNKELSYSSQAAVFLGNEFLLGRVGLLFQAGYYVHKMDAQKEQVYQKLGGNIYLVKKEKGLFKEVFASAILKTHLASAELFEMGLGIGL